jgi:molybdopterin-guanine dinucleotide biosynthesis protein A
MDIVGSGSALLLREPNRTKFHLWFVLTDPEGVDGLMIAVMVCTMKVFADETVLLEPGDHPFIKHESYVAYTSAKYVKRSRIEIALRSHHCFLKQSMSPPLLKRVQDGLLTSPYTVHAVRDYCAERF